MQERKHRLRTRAADRRAPQVAALVSAIAMCLGAVHSRAEDKCRSKFIACVQDTGDPAACQSVYNNCQVAPAVDPRRRELSESIETVPVGGQDGLRMLLRNDSDKPIHVGTRSRQVRCADGSTFNAYFSFNREIQPRERQQSPVQRVCADAGGMSQVASAGSPAPAAGGQSRQTLTFGCGDGSREFRVLALRGRTVRLEQLHPQGGAAPLVATYTIKRDDGGDLAEFLCSPMELASPSLGSMIRGQARRLAADLSTPDRAATAGKAATGVRD